MSLDPTAELNALRSRVVSIEEEKQKAVEEVRKRTEAEKEEAIRTRQSAIEQAKNPDQRARQERMLQQTRQYYSNLEKSRIKEVRSKFEKQRQTTQRNITAAQAIQSQETQSGKLDYAISFRDTQAGQKYIKENLPKNLQRQLRQAESRKGSEKNVAINKIKYLASGSGSSSYFDRMRAAEIKNREEALQQSAGLRAAGVRQNFNNLTYSTQQQLSKTEPRNKGAGTSSDPFRAQQPDQSLVASYLKGSSQYQQNIKPDAYRAVFSSGSTVYNVTTPDGKVRSFKSEEHAKEFARRVKGNYQKAGSFVGFSPSGLSYQGPPKPEETKIPAGTLEAIYGRPVDKKITATTESKGFIDNLGVELYNSLRYYDRVQAGEVEKPKGLEYLPYYSSMGLKPFVDIPLNLLGEKTSPTLSATAFDTGVELVTKGRTEKHDPIGSYIKEDPIRTLVQFPAEVVLWITGAKAAQATSKLVKTFSPLRYQKEIIPTVLKAKPTETVYRGLTWRDRPLLGIQSGKLTAKIDYEKVPYAKINVSPRGGFEAALGSGIEKNIYYSEKALSTQVQAKIIPKIGQQRATAWVSAIEQAKGVASKPGAIGAKPIAGLTEKQTKDIFAKVTAGQKKGDIEKLHGSIATRASVPESLQRKAGSSLILGDIDVIPKGGNLAVKADKLIQTFAKDFPLEGGQRLVVENVGKGPTTNRALKLLQKGKEDKKILEVVLKGADDESPYGIAVGDRILGQRIPFKKKMKLADWNIKTATADYQLLTNVKQALAYQPGRKAIPKSLVSGRTSDLEFHHLAKGSNVFEQGIILTRREHLGITALQGQLGKIKPPKGSGKVLKMLGERPSNLSKSEVNELEKYLRTERKTIKKTLEDAAAQVRDPTAFKGKPYSPEFERSAIGLKKDSSLFDIYPSSGRTKDIVRAYWNIKAKAVFRGGEKGKALDVQAEKIRKLYPGVEFTDVKPEKVLLYSSKLGEKGGGSSIKSTIAGETLTKSLSPASKDLDSSYSKATKDLSKPKESSIIQSSVSKDSLIKDYDYAVSRLVRDSRKIVDSSSVKRPSQLPPKPSNRLSQTFNVSNRPSSRIRRRDSSLLNIPKVGGSLMGTSKLDLGSVTGTPPSIKSPPSIKTPSPSLKIPPSIKTPPSLNIPSLKIPPSIKSPPSGRPPTPPPKFFDRPRRRPAVPVPFKWKSDKSFGVPRPDKRRYNYRGNTPEDAILGIYGKEKETTYNPKKILELSGRDKRRTLKDYRRVRKQVKLM